MACLQYRVLHCISCQQRTCKAPKGLSYGVHAVCSISHCASRQQTCQGAKGAKKAAAAAPKEVDADPEGAALAAVAAPLDEAARLARLLREHAGVHLRTHVLAYEVSALHNPAR